MHQLMEMIQKRFGVWGLYGYIKAQRDCISGEMKALELYEQK